MNFVPNLIVATAAVTLVSRAVAQNNAPNHRRLTSTILAGYQEKHEVTYDLNHWESVERVYVDGALSIDEADENPSHTFPQS